MCWRTTSCNMVRRRPRRYLSVVTRAAEFIAEDSYIIEELGIGDQVKTILLLGLVVECVGRVVSVPELFSVIIGVCLLRDGGDAKCPLLINLSCTCLTLVSKMAVRTDLLKRFREIQAL